MLSVGTVLKVRSCPVSNSTALIRYDVMSPFCNSKAGACHDILMLVELMEAAMTPTGGPVGAKEKIKVREQLENGLYFTHHHQVW